MTKTTNKTIGSVTNLQQLMLDQDDAHIWIVDREYSLVYANKKFKDYINATTGKEFQIGDSIFKSVIDQTELYKWHSYYDAAFKGIPVNITETIDPLVDITYHSFKIHIKALKDEQGTVIGLAGRAYPIQIARETNELSTSFFSEILQEYPVVTEDMEMDFNKYRQIVEQTSELAQIGSWEIDFSKEKQHRIYWSPVVRQILEVGDDYNSRLDDTFNFFNDGDHIRRLVKHLITEGKHFDEEFLIHTGLGNDKWIRIIGKVLNGQKIYGSIQDIHMSKTLQHQIKDILSSISDAFYALDNDGNITYFNKEAERLLDKTETEVIGKNLWKVFPTAADTMLQHSFDRVTKLRQPESFEYLFSDNNWYEVNAYPAPNGISVYFKNINKRKRVSEELKAAFEEKNTILESIGDAFFTADDDYVITYWNRVAEAIFKQPKEETIGKQLHHIFPASLTSELQKAKDSGQKVSFEEHIECLDMWFEITVYPSDKGLSVYFNDVTLRKRANRAVKEANERYEKVTEATEDAIWDWDIKTDKFYRSNNIRKFFGDEAKNLMTSENFWHDKFHPKDLQKLKINIQKALQDPKVNKWEMEYRIYNDKKEELYVIDRGIIIRDSQGDPIRMVGAMTDLTRQKRLESQLKEMNRSLNNYSSELERSNEELEQFAFVTSHDLQEPLRMISSFMEQLKRKYEDQLDKKALQYIHFAIDGAHRMKQIILDLLEFSRANRPTEGIETVSLEDVLSDFKQSRRKSIAETGAVIESDPLPAIKTYKAVISQIFDSLLDNALKYTHPNVTPVIQIKIIERHKEWEFSIADNGIGIDPQFFEKIFVMFQRLHNREAYDGTGIGLSIAKRCVEFLKGQIWLTSTVDKGTTFYFKIPKKNRL